MARDAAKPAFYDFSLLLLRLILGLVFILHGSQKLFGWLDGPGMGGYTAITEVQQLEGSERQAKIEELRALPQDQRRERLAAAAGNEGSGFVNMVAGSKINIPFTGQSYSVPYAEYAAYIAAYSEFAGGILVALGFLTRLGALFLFGTMIGAILMMHHNAFFASNGGMEYPLTLGVVALALVFAGGGDFSLWGLLTGRCCGGRKKEEEETEGARSEETSDFTESEHEAPRRPDVPPSEPYRPDLG